MIVTGSVVLGVRACAGKGCGIVQDTWSQEAAFGHMQQCRVLWDKTGKESTEWVIDLKLGNKLTLKDL